MFSRIGFQLLPGAKRFDHQSSVREIRIGMPRDSCRPVRAAAFVSDFELFDERDRLSALRQLTGRRRAHRPRAEDQVFGVLVFHVARGG